MISGSGRRLRSELALCEVKMKDTRSRKYSAVITNVLLAMSLIALGFAIGNIYAPTPTTAAGFTVGYVDIQALLLDHPAWPSVEKKIKAYDQQELAKLEKASKEATTPQKRQENVDLALDAREKMRDKHKELAKPLYDNIMAKVKEVGEESRIEIIIDKTVVYYGIEDLTSAVRDRLSKNLIIDEKPKTSKPAK